jgi:hypothetical protein
MEYARRLLRGKKYTQDRLIPFVVLVIGSFGGVAEKAEVDDKMYRILEEDFSDDICHETVANNIPRWRHDIAWAKERAKQIHSYVKSAEDSGRGIWELTVKGKNYYGELIIKIERSTAVIRRKKNA